MAATLAGGNRVVFSGSVEGYHGPRSYSVSAAYGHFLLDYGARIYSGRTAGSVTVLPGARSLKLSLSLTNVVSGMPPGTVHLSGAMRCMSFTTA